MSGRPVIGKIFKNFGYKLTALALATLVWYVVQGEEVLEVSAKLDVKIETPANLAIKDAAVVARDITLRGPRVLVGTMAGKTFLAVIRVPPGKSGNLRYRLDKEFIPRWDNRVRITIHDPYITFAVEERLTKMVAVRPTIIGDAEPPQALDEAVAAPSEIEISGAKSDIARLTEITTEPIDISHLTESKTVSTAISRAALPEVAITQPNVRVSLRIGPKKSLKTISVVPIEITDADKVASAHPASVALVIRASDDFLSKMNQRDLRASVSVKDLSPGRYDLIVSASAPEGVQVKEINPKTVSVEIYNQKKLK